MSLMKILIDSFSVEIYFVKLFAQERNWNVHAERKKERKKEGNIHFH